MAWHSPVVLRSALRLIWGPEPESRSRVSVVVSRSWTVNKESHGGFPNDQLRTLYVGSVILSKQAWTDVLFFSSSKSLSHFQLHSLHLFQTSLFIFSYLKDCRDQWLENKIVNAPLSSRYSAVWIDIDVSHFFSFYLASVFLLAH